MTRLFKYHEFLNNSFKSNESDYISIVNEKHDEKTGIYTLNQTEIDKMYSETNLNNFVSNMKNCFYNFIYFTLKQNDQLYSLSGAKGDENTHFDYEMKKKFIGNSTYLEVAEMIKKPFEKSDGVFQKISEDNENKNIVQQFQNAVWLKAQLKKEYQIQNSYELMNKFYSNEKFSNIKVPKDTVDKTTYEFFKARFEDGKLYFRAQSQALFDSIVKSDSQYSNIIELMKASTKKNKMINESQIFSIFTEYYTNFHLWLYANSLTSNIDSVQVKKTEQVSQKYTNTPQKSTKTVVSPPRPVSTTTQRMKASGLLD